jgi:hypothetical protein
MNFAVLSLIFGVFIIPFSLTFWVAKKGWLAGIIVPLALPISSMLTIHRYSFYWYGIVDAPMESGGAPMSLVVYILYGVPATLISLIIWFQFRQKHE